MAGRELSEIIDPDWAQALQPVAGRIAAMGDFLRAEIAAGRRYLPPGEQVLRAFTQPFGAARVLFREPAKWIARLRATARGGPFLLKTEMTAGHGGRSGRYDAWREEALILAWIVTTAKAG